MRGRLLRRYKRFLVDIETERGEVITAFCPATGRMRTCSAIGAPVEYHPVGNSDRRTDYDWWSIRMPDSWVVIDTRPANELLYQHRGKPWFPDGWTGARWHAEPTVEDGGRLDFRLESDTADVWIEVKSVTWAEDGVGYFPDAPSDRALRHLDALAEKARAEQAVLVLMTMRSDVEEIRPARRVDPAFADRLKEIQSGNVDLFGVRNEVGPRSVSPVERIPVTIE